jgi:hypothetical protein
VAAAEEGVPPTATDSVAEPEPEPNSSRTGSDPMDVIVVTLTGKRIAVQLEGSDTIETVKAKIHDQDKDGTPPDQQRLIFDSQEMVGTVASCKITDGSLVHLVVNAAAAARAAAQAENVKLKEQILELQDQLKPCKNCGNVKGATMMCWPVMSSFGTNPGTAHYVKAQTCAPTFHGAAVVHKHPNPGVAAGQRKCPVPLQGIANYSSRGHGTPYSSIGQAGCVFD